MEKTTFVATKNNAIKPHGYWLCQNPFRRCVAVLFLPQENWSFFANFIVDYH